MPSVTRSVESSLLSPWEPFQELLRAFLKGVPHLRVDGLWGAARGLVIEALLRASERSALVLVSRLPEVHQTRMDLRFFEQSFGAGPLSATAFPPGPPAFWSRGRQRDSDAERALLCSRLLAGERVTVVTTPAALATPLLAPHEFRSRAFHLDRGATVIRDTLLHRLMAAGYERVDTVVEVGQWSLRGGIVDIFSAGRTEPVRIEFFGDEIESLRTFDPTSQRSVHSVDGLEVLPLTGGGPEGGRELMSAESAGAVLLDYLPPSAPVALYDPALLEAPPEGWVAGGGAGDGAVPSPTPLHTLLAGRQRIELGLLALSSGGGPEGGRELGSDDASVYHLETRSVGSFRGQFRLFAPELQQWLAEGFRVRLVCQDDLQTKRLREILREHLIEPWPAGEAGLWGPEGLLVLTGECSTGFSIPALGLTLLTEEELFGARRRPLRRPLFQKGASLAAFTELQLGDLIVHEEHGLGRYLGLQIFPVEGREGEFLLLEYAEGNRLYLPVERLGVVSKYLGGDGAPARLDRLGGSSWQRVKESVRAATRQMAEEILQLYAARSVLEGHAFSPDVPWQREFEAAFRFEETPDQIRAIEEVKADMEAHRSMDRLVAGDVGYGKTEVALRAAFKAVTDGRQVALLVPTTILAQQHWATFTERFAPFPVRVELLSRFRSANDQKAVLAGLRQGTVDVVIGTHRLLSRDVAFKDLGLLIVDEEHRFGVAHKERIKRLRKSVDVLTLTATPIPRTLYMSLSGVRDLSVIETPPLDRLPVETMISRFDRWLIKEAIERELDRGGQVFFVHNRVQSLPSMTAFLRRLVPGARVVMAHGQMRERELEGMMVRFVTGQADVLVSTAIVESGLDIPASNTIIVNRADRFGLAQLYQLRGRVGRERLQAYAYFLIPADGRIDETAQKRLHVIQELTELGSGFKLALRDLEIRGAGNLLGAEQHGHIAAVGFDLYTKLLAEAVRELKGEPEEAAVDPVVTVEVEAFLPETYVPEVNQRLGLYKRLAGLTRSEAIGEIRSELVDRFGPLPLPAERLLQVVELRVAAKSLGVEKIEAADGKALVTFAPSTPVFPERLLQIIRDGEGQIRLLKEFVVEASLPRGPWPVVHGALADLLGRFL
jgi:transcription-repair coupling factor (superfamily II helicase)